MLLVTGNFLEMFLFTKIEMGDQMQDMKVTTAKAQIADNVTDALVSQIDIDGNSLAIVIYETNRFGVKSRDMIMITFTVQDDQKPYLFILGFYHNLDRLANSDLRSTQLLSFEPDFSTGKNYLILSDSSQSWTLFYTEPFSMKLKKKCQIKLSSIPGEETKLRSSVKDLLVVAKKEVIEVYRFQYSLADKTLDYNLDFDSLMLLSQTIHLPVGSALSNLKTFVKNEKIYIAFSVDSTLHVYCSSDKVFSEADSEQPDSISSSSTNSPGSKDQYFGEPELYSKFTKLFESQIEGKILNFDAI